MSALTKGVRVRITHGGYQGVIGFIEAQEGPSLRVRVAIVPPHLERRSISEFITVRAVDSIPVAGRE